MLTGNGRDYKDIPHLTEGDEEFRSKFLSWELGDISFTDVNEYLKEKDTILVPMASFEQHGPHLPILTDTITAIEISCRVSEMIAVLHTPPIWLGYSPQHMHEPGRGRGTGIPLLLQLCYCLPCLHTHDRFRSAGQDRRRDREIRRPACGRQARRHLHTHGDSQRRSQGRSDDGGLGAESHQLLQVR